MVKHSTLNIEAKPPLHSEADIMQNWKGNITYKHESFIAEAIEFS